jgi:hypothetical protein
MTPAPVDRSVALPRVAAALCAIAVLALVLPYAAVQAFHQRRLDTASRQLEAMAVALGQALATPSAIPAGTQLLAGNGPRPAVIDDLWTTAAAFPLAKVSADPGSDPWGNAYLVNIRDRSHAWVISAGPDGIVQTPFAAPNGPVADDRVVTVR